MSYDGKLIFDTKIDSKGFEKGVKTLSGAAKKSMDTVNKVFKIGGVAVAAIGTLAIKSGAEFEKGMDRVGALSGATADELDQLTATARQLGRDTVFSAQEAAEGMEFLAMAGFDTNEIIGTMPGLLDLAAAGQVELGTASDITSNILSGFNLQAEEAGRVADVMTKAFTSSNTSVESLGDSMKYVAPVAAGVGFSIEETTAAIGKLGDAGIQGTQAGTALRGIMLRLVDPPKEAAAALDSLGVSVKDAATGEMKEFPQIIRELEEATKDMTEADRAAILAKVAGQNASSALMALVAEGGDELAKFTEELENSGGIAEEVANKQLQGLLGQLELLKSALSDMGLTIYETLNMPLGEVVGTLNTYVDKMNDVIETNKAAAEETGDMAYAVRATAEEIGMLGGQMIAELIEHLPVAVRFGTSFMQMLVEGFRSQFPEVAEAVVQMITTFTMAYIEMVPLIMEMGIIFFSTLAQGLADALPDFMVEIIAGMESVINTIMEQLPAMLEAVQDAYPVLVEGAAEIVPMIAEAIIEAIPMLVETGAEIILSLATGLGENLPELISLGMDLVIELADAIIDNMDTIIKAGIEIVKGLAQGLADNLPKFIEEAPRIINEFTDAIMENLPAILKAGLEIIVELAKGLIQAIPTLVANIPQIIRAIINAFMLANWAGTGKKLMEGIRSGISGAGPKVVEVARKIAKGAIKGIENFFKNGPKEGIKLVTGLIKGLLSKAGSLISEAGNMARSAVDGIIEKFLTAPDIGKDLVKGIWNGIKGMTGWLTGKIKDWAGSLMDGIKGFFGIKSPSRRMRDEVGTELVRGIMVGIQDETPELRDVAETEMMKLVDDYAVYGRKAAQAYGKLSKEEMKKLKEQHKDDGEALAEAIADGIKNKTDSVVGALERLRKQTIGELDKLGAATIKALEYKYKEERDLLLDNIESRLNIEKSASKERLKIYEEEHLRKLELLDDETSEEVRAIQDKIDAINRELEAEQEAKEHEEYLEKVAQAKEKIRVAKTNRDRTQAQKELDKLIADQRRKEFEKQKKDEIRALEDQMKLVKDNAKKKESQLDEEYKQKQEHEQEQMELVEERLNNEKEMVKEHYEVLLREEQLQAEARKLILAENNDELIELLDSYNPYWMDAGQSFGESLIDGLNSMKYEVQAVVDDMLSMVATAELANAKILQAKQDWHAANLRGDKKAMDAAHRQAERYRKQGGTIGADQAINVKAYEKQAQARNNNPYANGVSQNITIVSPKNTPSENARLMKRKGEELMYGY